MEDKCRTADPLREKYAPLLNGITKDPHSLLGMHTLPEEEGGGGVIVRVYDPVPLEVLLHCEGKVYPMEKILPEGLYTYTFPGRKEHFNYTVEKVFASGERFIAEDPYHFLPGAGEMDLYLFNEGKHRRLYDFLGAHVHYMGSVRGVRFTLWAPNAKRVSVIGDFNGWDGRRHMMRLLGSSGVWELFIPGLCPGDLYKYEIFSSDDRICTKLDPCAQWTELRPGNAARVPEEEEFPWEDEAWMFSRSKSDPRKGPLNIYEVHLGSWGGPGSHGSSAGENVFPNYRDLAHKLAAYVKEMHYTHVELLPVFEHPLDQSWGYQVSGFYAPTSRYGTPEDFAYFVNYMHKNSIGVILDWVGAHFPKDAFSLGRFDGSALYEHADPRQGEQPDWGTYIFNFGRNEVKNFLIGSALCFLEKFHVDGLRADAVASMLYLDYSRKAGEWIPNQYGGNINLEAVAFLQELNDTVKELYPGVLMAAEESTTYSGVTSPTREGGLGFTFKWNMGWMHDTLDYYALDPIHRKFHHNLLTFTLEYAFQENYILVLSHDEVVHGKKSLINRMPGSYEEKFASLRTYYGGMMAHPGKKLLFMGGEFGQWIEWNCMQDLDFHLLEYPMHSRLREMNRVLNEWYRKEPAFWELDHSPEGFEWIDGGNEEQSVVSFFRWNKTHDDGVLVILNLTPVVRENFSVGVPLHGQWKECFNSDSLAFGGRGVVNREVLHSSPGMFHGQKQCITLFLGGLSAQYWKCVMPCGRKG